METKTTSDNLTEKAFWETVNDAHAPTTSAPSRGGIMKRLGRRLIGPEKLARYSVPYSGHYLWDILLPELVARRASGRVLEVGSAPGHNLVQFHQRFGYEPYGVEYSASGVDANRALFRQHNLNPENVIHSDFFAESFQEKYKEFFDIVISGGFIEHFNDVGRVIDHHLRLLAPGGQLIILIPNLRGLNYWSTWLLAPDVLPAHNLSLMDLKRFDSEFQRSDLRKTFCGYFGGISLLLSDLDRKTGAARILAPVMRKAQLALDMATYAMFDGRSCRNRFLSPYLGFIGTKQAS